MRSVADELARELREKVRKLPVAERIALAFRLGESDVETLQQARGMRRAAAVRHLQRRRQARRRRCRCIEELIG